MAAVAKELDKFYTKQQVAQECVNHLLQLLPELQQRPFIEPSAGAGAFVDALKKAGVGDITALDIAPEQVAVRRQDFLSFTTSKRMVAVGNPPFGRRCQLALQFLCHAVNFCDVVAFILPKTFKKYSFQKFLPAEVHLVSQVDLPDESFELLGRPYCVRSVFQVWAWPDRLSVSLPDLRKRKKPATSHPDFRLWQHNATVASRVALEEDWEFAYFRQGYKDYRRIFTKTSDYQWLKQQIETTSDQFFFVKPLTDRARQFCLTYDFDALAQAGISTKGFGKSDFVDAYLTWLHLKQ